MNLQAVMNNNPVAAEFMNVSYKNGAYAEPFRDMDSHAPKRSFNESSPM